MANTIMSAKNSFEEGLLMDLSPDNTQANCMTSALNATLLTFNGNEMLLLNDMGNGRVETARLPEGYVPLGTCEFGDIIYIVSYNPITNKSLIGCFPSPERNITTDEILDIGQKINYTDFLDNSLNGTIKNTAVKKVLIETKKLNPGDKYIIYTDLLNTLSSNASLLSDWGAKKHNIDPRAIKLHVVSIEDTGKITYLDTTTKWYDDYYIKEGAVKVAGGKTDLDSYRNLVSSEWSIFTSKVSGKLAILAELETIDSFSCSYLLEKFDGDIERNGIKYKKYKIKLLPSYQAKEGVLNPYIFITNCGFQKIDDAQTDKLTVVYVTSEKNDKRIHKATNLTENLSRGWEWPDRHKFDAEILLEDGGEIYFEIPYKAIDTKTKTEHFINSESFVYNFTVVPSMGIPNGSGGWKMFGRLDYLKVDLTIDFNKVGTGDVDFYTWKYHNSDESSMLTYGINTYPEPNCEVKFIQMDFYDHLGHVVQYILDGRKSYNGTFNEYFSLGGQNSNFRISKYYIDESPVADPTEINNKKKRPTEWSDNPNIIKHFVEETIDVSGMTEDFDYITTGKSDKEGNPIYLKNTAGTIYPGALYGVKILVWLGPIGSYAITLDWIKRKKVYHRWFWTNAMFNEYYYNTKDFNDLLFELILDSKALFETNSKKYIWNTKEIMNLSENFDNNQLYKTYSANVLYIGESMADDNIFMYIQGGLKNDYKCFNLINSLESKNYTGGGGLENIKAEILLGQAKINYTIKGDLYEFTGNSINMTETTFLETTNIIKNDGKRADFKYLHDAINTEEIKENGLKDDFNINFIGQTPDVITEENIDFQKITTDLSKCYYLNYEYKQSLPLNMSAIIFNKAYTQNIYSNNLSVPVYTPIISSTDDLFSLGISGIWETNDSVPSAKFKRYDDGGDYKGIKLGFNTAMSIGCYDSNFTGTDFNLDGGTLTFTSAVMDDDKIKFKAERGINPASDSEYIDKIWGKFSERMNQFFLIYPGGYGNKPNQFAVTDGSISNYSNANIWYSKNKGSVPSSKPESVFITGGAYDITEDAQFEDMDYGNRVGLLATKHKLGYTILNAALNDWWYGADKTKPDYNVNLGFSQTGMKHSSNGVFLTFENFAYHLYLILSRAFHKNKRIEDTSINLRNYVKNGNSEITFIKDIVVKLSSKDETKNDIALQKMSFKEYSNIICNMSIFNEATEDGNALKDSKNIKLKFIESAINNELTINIKNLPLSIINVDAEAYLLYNGLLIPTYNLANGLFYMYNSGKLQVYLNGHLSFDIKEVSDNLKYLFSGIIPADIDIVNLRGVHPPKLETLTPAQIAYNKFVDEVHKVTTSADFLAILRIYLYETDLERMDIKNTLINQILAMMSTEYIDTYSKYDLSNMVKGQMYTGNDAELGKWNDLFSTWPINTDPLMGSNTYGLELNIYQTLPYDNTYLPAEKYEFDCGLNLSSFNYENNILALKDNGVYSMFGIRDYDLGNSAYVGLVRNIVIDQEFKIV